MKRLPAEALAAAVAEYVDLLWLDDLEAWRESVEGLGVAGTVEAALDIGERDGAMPADHPDDADAVRQAARVELTRRLIDAVAAGGWTPKQS